MSKKKIKPNGKHLTEEDRAFIAEALQAGLPFKEIGNNHGVREGSEKVTALNKSKQIRINIHPYRYSKFY